MAYISGSTWDEHGDHDDVTDIRSMTMPINTEIIGGRLLLSMQSQYSFANLTLELSPSETDGLARLLVGRSGQ